MGGGGADITKVPLLQGLRYHPVKSTRAAETPPLTPRLLDSNVPPLCLLSGAHVPSRARTAHLRGSLIWRDVCRDSLGGGWLLYLRTLWISSVLPERCSLCLGGLPWDRYRPQRKHGSGVRSGSKSTFCQLVIIGMTLGKSNFLSLPFKCLSCTMEVRMEKTGCRKVVRGPRCPSPRWEPCSQGLNVLVSVDFKGEGVCGGHRH